MMTAKKKETRERQIKIQGTASLKEFVDAFVSGHPTIGSRNTFAERAFRYFAKKYDEAGGRTDTNGFPLDMVAEDESTYRTKGPPLQKKKGSS